MRINVYAEEITDRVEIVTKEIDGKTYTGIRFYLELPATDQYGVQHRGPFMHHPGDDDSSAITFWGKTDIRKAFAKAIDLIDERYRSRRGGV